MLSFYSSSFLNLGKISHFFLLKWSINEGFCNESTDKIYLRCTFIFNKIKASEVYDNLHVFFQDFLSEDLERNLWFCASKEHFLTGSDEQINTDRSQTNAYGASKFRIFHYILLCEAFEQIFCLISLMNWRMEICIFILWNVRL